MTQILNNLNYLRYGNNFDYSKVPIIRHDIGKLKLDVTINTNNRMDELRISNATMNPPRPKIIPEVDMVELERMRKYGLRVDARSSSLYERFAKKVMKVPRRRPNGTIIYNPPLPVNQQTNLLVDGLNPVMTNITFSELLNTPFALGDRLNQLITNINASPQLFAQQNRAMLDQQTLIGINTTDFQDDMRSEVELIRQHLFNKTFSPADNVFADQSPEFIARENVLTNLINNSPSELKRAMQFSISQNTPVLLSPEEVAGNSNQMSQRGYSALALVGMTFRSRATPLQAIIPAYRAFVASEYGNRATFNLSESVLEFQTSGGVVRWLRERGNEPQAIESSAQMGSPFDSTPQTSDIIDEEPSEKEEDEKAETTPIASTITQPTQTTERQTIIQIFENAGISLPNDDGYLNAEWYDAYVHNKTGTKKAFIKALTKMKNPIYNNGNSTITGTENYIAKSIKNGVLKIHLINETNFVLENV